MEHVIIGRASGQIMLITNNACHCYGGVSTTQTPRVIVVKVVTNKMHISNTIERHKVSHTSTHALAERNSILCWIHDPKIVIKPNTDINS